MKNSQSKKFCRCIKHVRKTIRARNGKSKESGAIGVCVHSVLQRRGRTLKKFKCGQKPVLITQKPFRGGSCGVDTCTLQSPMA